MHEMPLFRLWLGERRLNSIPPNSHPRRASERDLQRQMQLVTHAGWGGYIQQPGSSQETRGEAEVGMRWPQPRNQVGPQEAGSMREGRVSPVGFRREQPAP